MSARKRIVIIISLLLSLGLACSMPQSSTAPSQPAGSRPETGANDPGSPDGPSDPAAGKALKPTAASIDAPSHPIGLRQGLAGLNSYRMETRIIFRGPTEADEMISITLTEYVKDGNKFHMRATNTTRSVDVPTPTTETGDEYRFGALTCTLATVEEGLEVEVSETPPAEQTMMEYLMNLFDVIIHAENPKLVGAEDVNGIMANHYTFEISGLQAATGAEVTHASGEYWVAQSGQYLVKYFAKIGTRYAPAGSSTADETYLEESILMSDVDQPFDIILPPECNP